MGGVIQWDWNRNYIPDISAVIVQHHPVCLYRRAPFIETIKVTYSNVSLPLCE